MSEAMSGAEAIDAGQGEAPPGGEGGDAGNISDSPWYGEVEGELKGWVENKAWKTPVDALQSARNLEKLLGADRAGNTVIIPKEGDAEGWGSLYERLGRPEGADGYKFSLEEGQQEGDLGAWFRGKAHEAGLTQEQAASLYGGFNELMAQTKEDSAAQSAAEQQQDISSLRKEWGQEYDTNILAGKKAANRFGLEKEQLSSIESAIGTKGMLSLMAKIGRAMGEHSFVSDDSTGGDFGMTPAAAQHKIAGLLNDESFTKAYLDAQNPGHKSAVDKMKALQQAANPEL